MVSLVDIVINCKKPIEVGKLKGWIMCELGKLATTAKDVTAITGTRALLPDGETEPAKIG